MVWMDWHRDHEQEPQLHRRGCLPAPQAAVSTTAPAFRLGPQEGVASTTPGREDTIAGKMVPVILDDAPIEAFYSDRYYSGSIWTTDAAERSGRWATALRACRTV